MPESSLVKDICGSSAECRTPHLRQFSQCSPLLRRRFSTLNTFCTQQNVQECLSHINQELSSLGLSPLWTDVNKSSELNIVAVLNCVHDLIQLHRKCLRTLESMEVEQLKSNSKLDYLQHNTTRLQEQVECSKRETTGLLEKERQLQQKVKSLQNYLKNEKDEVQKLQNVVVSRTTQHNHEMKRKEREFSKLKERMNQLLTDKKERKQAIDLLNNIGRSDGKRSVWKTEKTEAKHEGDMYKTLLSDYDARQRELVLENSELLKVLQQMKNDMVSLLNLRKMTQQGDHLEVSSEEDEDTSYAREKLTNSIRLQWRRLKSHVEQLDSQVLEDRTKHHTAPGDTHEEEMEKLKLEVQQCKNFIQAQQQLLHYQLSSSCDDTSSLMSDGLMLQEKERFRGELQMLEEQRKAFERERRSFTEAAIRLSQERKAFEEDRAMWLKNQFLSMSPFGEFKKALTLTTTFPISDSALNKEFTAENPTESPSDLASSSQRPSSLPTTTTTDLNHAPDMMPGNNSVKPKFRSQQTEE